MEIGPLHNKIPITDSMNQSESGKNEVIAGKIQKKDSAIISNEAREKLAELADNALIAELKAKQARLDSIKNKINSGYYNNKEVKEIIADKIIDDLE